MSNYLWVFYTLWLRAQSKGWLLHLNLKNTTIICSCCCKFSCDISNIKTFRLYLVLTANLPISAAMSFGLKAFYHSMRTVRVAMSIFLQIRVKMVVLSKQHRFLYDYMSGMVLLIAYLNDFFLPRMSYSSRKWETADSAWIFLQFIVSCVEIRRNLEETVHQRILV